MGVDTNNHKIMLHIKKHSITVTAVRVSESKRGRAGSWVKRWKKRLQAGWSWWRKESGVNCDKIVAAEVKRKVYKRVVRPAVVFGSETVDLNKRQEAELELAVRDVGILFDE